MYACISYLHRLHLQFVGLLNHNSLMIHLLLFTFHHPWLRPQKNPKPGPSPSIRSCRSPTWIIPISQFVDQNCLVFEDQEAGSRHGPVSLGIGGMGESLSARKISGAPRRWWLLTWLPTLVFDGFCVFFTRCLGRRIYFNIGEDYEKWSGVFLMGWKPRAFCW